MVYSVLDGGDVGGEVNVGDGDVTKEVTEKLAKQDIQDPEEKPEQGSYAFSLSLSLLSDTYNRK